MNEQPTDSGEVVNTGGAPYIKGNANTDGGNFVGRDKITNILGDEVHGDKVGGNKVTISTFINNLFSGDSEAVRKQRNRQAMLILVRDIWVKGVLEQSLHGVAMLELGMESWPSAVEHPWDVIVQMPDQPSYRLPPGTTITQVFDETKGSLLLLGEPGSGKTTMLLELARTLIARAAQDAVQPIPVVFNLASWAEKRPPIAE